LAAKHIFIGGTSFTGSTLIGLILGAIPGVGNVGESNWLVPRLGEADASPKLWSGYESMEQCRLCGSACEVWTKEFRMDLQRNAVDWFERLAARLGTNVLVSSEKETPLVNALDPQKRYAALILFREPGQFWSSIRKRPWRQDTIQQATRRWTAAYSEFLEDTYRPEGGKIFMNVDAFQTQPAPRLRVLLELLGIEGDVESVLRYWESQQHYVGGNFNVYRELENKGAASLALRPPEALSLATKEHDFIQNHEAAEIYQRLLNQTPGLSDPVAATPI
jgi:hypothetical protein